MRTCTAAALPQSTWYEGSAKIGPKSISKPIGLLGSDVAKVCACVPGSHAATPRRAAQRMCEMWHVVQQPLADARNSNIQVDKWIREARGAEMLASYRETKRARKIRASRVAEVLFTLNSIA